MNTQAQTQPTEKIADTVQHIEETMMVELQQTTYRIPGNIFCMESLFPSNANKAALGTPMTYKPTEYPDNMYLHEAKKKPYSNEFKKAMKK